VKIAWFAIGFMFATATNIVGFVRRTHKLKRTLQAQKIDLGQGFWQWWIGM
jgi:hypothetical protein